LMRGRELRLLALGLWLLLFLVSACLVDNYAERRAWSLFEI
jgi:hypothetical protein